MRVPPLQWDPDLARAAISYGRALAASGRLQHSPKSTRPGQRENLWRGTANAYSTEQMIANWVAEKRNFRGGIFPDVSRTGDWRDVSRYSTMIWRTTASVGCGVYKTRKWDYLICRYSPPGNIDGQFTP